MKAGKWTVLNISLINVLSGLKCFIIWSNVGRFF